MKTIIAGSRDGRLSFADKDKLDELRRLLPITEVVSGHSRGVDREGEAWAATHELNVERFPADWATLGNAAGPIRNQRMADYADALIAFPGGKGTADMVYKATKAGLHVIDLRSMEKTT